MIVRQRGAALLLFMVVLVGALAALLITRLRSANAADARRMADQRSLALAVEALRGAAFARHCSNTSVPLSDVLPCPDGAATEGIAAASCPGLTRGWLPWRSLGLPPLKDSSGTCLWYERQGTTARVIAPGAATAGQNRGAAAGRSVCGGNLAEANYLDAADVSLALSLDTATMVARCP
jgi:hypothetical protein